MEKNITYQTRSSYSTLNSINANTKRIWFAFHGLGYLSKYFIKYFERLSIKDFVIAPQAPSVYYQDAAYKRVGANWYTRENVHLAREGINNYLNAVFKAEIGKHITQGTQLVFVGYSQGVSALLRWMAQSQTCCDVLIIHSGGIPQELTPDHFKFLPKSTTVYYVCGSKDEYLTEDRLKSEMKKGKALFGNRLDVCFFEGNHVFNLAFVETLLQK